MNQNIASVFCAGLAVLLVAGCAQEQPAHEGNSTQMAAQRGQIEQASFGTGVRVTQIGPNRLQIDVPSDAGFASDSPMVNPRLFPVLDAVARALASRPDETVQILGYTDSSGSDLINLPLSLNRAQSVDNYLVSRGIASARITAKGLGDSDPVASNATPAGRSLNRRVDIYLSLGAAR